MPGIRAHEHQARAAEHARLGQALYETKHEWCAVALFYAAYHLVRGALRSDPVFDDLSRLKGINANLVPEDRESDVHQGRRGGSDARIGVNDLVMLLYPSIAGKYDLLHQASIQVRYNSRLFLPLDRLWEASEVVRLADARGDLVAVY